MPRVPVAPSSAIAQLLRSRRRSLGLTLREVERRTSETGKVIPFTTLAKIEVGAVDPGISRLHALLRLYHLPMGAANDLLEIESLAAGRVPADKDPAKLINRANAAWQEGNTAEALSCLLALRRETSERPELLRTSQESVLNFAVLAGKLGRHHLSRQMLDELLTERPHRELLVGILVQQASSWNALGAPEAALAYLDRAAVHLEPDQHRYHGWVAHQRASIEMSLSDFPAAETNLKQAIRSFRIARRPYDQAVAMAALSRLYVERGDAPRAIRAARAASDFASSKKFARVRVLAAIQYARAQLLAEAPEPALVVLRTLLADAVAASDNVARFYAHFYLWKAYAALGANARAAMERREATYYLRFTDEASQEATELGGLGATKSSRSKA